MHLQDFIKPHEPLGPIKHDVVREDLICSTRMLSDVDPLRSIFENKASIIIGRKGSGKTAAVMAYRSFAKYGKFHGDISDFTKNGVDINISVIEWGQFHDMVRNVAQRAFGSNSHSGLADFVGSEHTANMWSEVIWDLIFQTFYQAAQNDDKLHCDLPSIIKLFETEELISGAPEALKARVRSDFEASKLDVFHCLEKHNKKCVLLIDTMEDYPIKNPLFERVIGGFLKCVGDFSIFGDRIRIVFCLPEELESFFEDHSSNTLKDLGNPSRLEWKPSELLRVVAERYRLYLNLYEAPEDQNFLKKLKQKDFSRRSDLQWFFQSVMERDITNAYGATEDALAFLIRHTQLLPREFIMLFSEAIRISRDSTGPGSKSWITADATVQAVENMEAKLGSFLLDPYKRLYPRFIDACNKILPELPVFCKKSDLDSVGKRFKGLIEDDIYDVWSLLYSFGVLGYVDESLQDKSTQMETERYVLAHFRYNSKIPISIRNGRLYCIHPLFSRTWGMRRQNEYKKKFVYPANIEHMRVGT